MKKTVLAALLGLSACAHSPFDPEAGCETVSAPAFAAEGYTVKSCAHPFAILNGNPKDCSRSTLEASAASGPLLPCGWVKAYTNRQTKVVKYWELYPESLDHEYLHVTNRISDDW